MRLLWALFAFFGAAILVTYWRLPLDELYNVGEDGLDGAAGRLLVYLNYPTSLAAIPIAWLAAVRIATPHARWAAVAATVFCAVTAWPGVVDKTDLDAKPINVIPAVGVAIALVLSLRAPWEEVGRLRLDPARIVVGVVVWLFALPWVTAIWGFHFPGDVLLGEELKRGGEGTVYAAVHLGDNEGLDAALLVTAALVLSRYRAPFAVTAVLGLAFLYGLAVEWRDFWFEQVNKREWTAWGPPNLLTPRLSVGWVTLVLLAFVLAVIVRRLEAPRRPGADPRRGAPAPAPGSQTEGSTRDGRSP